jgi:hypothetical protein
MKGFIHRGMLLASKVKLCAGSIVPDPGPCNTDPDLWIRILWYGSGSSMDFRQHSPPPLSYQILHSPPNFPHPLPHTSHFFHVVDTIPNLHGVLPLPPLQRLVPFPAWVIDVAVNGFFKMPTKIIFMSKLSFLLITFRRYIYICLQRY